MKKLHSHICKKYPQTCPSTMTKSAEFFLFTVIFLQHFALSLSFLFLVFFLVCACNFFLFNAIYQYLYPRFKLAFSPTLYKFIIRVFWAWVHSCSGFKSKLVLTNVIVQGLVACISKKKKDISLKNFK